MNFLELYEARPSNYFICADLERNQFAGGIGKSSQMEYLAHEICGKEVQGRIVIPIYAKMSELNTKQVDSDVLYQFLLAYFPHHVTKKAVVEMIRKSQGHQFLFLLDGINEVNNYVLANGQTVYDCVGSNIKELIQNDNVHIIITSRSENEILFDSQLKDTFEKRYLCPLEHQQYKDYLQMGESEVLPEPLVKICENAMLLRMFKTVYEADPEKALSLKSRYDLMEHYFQLDAQYKRNPMWNDNLSKARRFLVDKILPYIAFKVVSAHLQEDENLLVKMEYESLLKSALKECEAPQLLQFALVDKVIQMTGLLDKNLNFQHDMIRDYFAVKGLEKRWEYAGALNAVKQFMENLNQNMRYDSSRGMDYVRRTRFMDFCEFLYAAIKEELQVLLKKCNFKVESKEYAFQFYFNLAGLYKDLILPKLAEEFSEIAIPLLEELEEEGVYSDFVRADFYNYLGYCIATRNDSLLYLERAKNILEQSEDLSKKEKRLMGRILSNIGAFYYARKDYDSARIWHQRAMDYRCENELWEDVIHSCRTLMSDYYMLKQYDKAYQCFLKGLEFLEEGTIDLEFEERAMGSEIALLGMPELTETMREELLQRLVNQIKTVYEGASASHRRNLNLLESLYKKMQNLEKFLSENLNSEVLAVVLNYKQLCLAALKGTKKEYEL